MVTSTNDTSMLSERLKSHTPASLGFRMPAEWELHAATLMSWPRNDETWPNNLNEAQAEFLELANAIAADEPVYILADEAEQPQLASGSKLRILPVPTNDAWLRDYGPTYVVSNDRKSRIAIDWQYNAWGGKYPPFDEDQRAVHRILNCDRSTRTDIQAERYSSELCIEGGAIDTNSSGVLLTTRTCALDQNRNANWSANEVEAEFKKCLGINNVVWLGGESIIGDDTDGHIDQLARFVADDHIVYCSTNDPNDPQSSGLARNLNGLKSSFEELGIEIQLTPLPLPAAVHQFGSRLPASFCNFYITNKSVIVPQFGEPDADKRAVCILTELFPSRNVIGLPSLQLAVGLGSFHCLTQQVPALKSETSG